MKTRRVGDSRARDLMILSTGLNSYSLPTHMEKTELSDTQGRQMTYLVSALELLLAGTGNSCLVLLATSEPHSKVELIPFWTVLGSI
jgi:hypothetical protein